MSAVTVQHKPEPKQQLFKDLPSGQYYYDNYGNLCMKINNDNTHNCIVYDDDKKKWTCEEEDANESVRPVEAILIIEGAE